MAIFLLNNYGLFTIFLQSPLVAYNNEPIEARFTLAGYVSPDIKGYYNDQQVFEILNYEVNESIFNATTNETTIITKNVTINQTVTFSKEYINGTYILRLSNVNTEGTFKFVVSEGNLTETQVIEVRNPYVDISNNIKNIVDNGAIEKIEIRTLTPQNKELDADSVEILVIHPDRTEETLNLDKSGSLFSTNFNYQKNGNYQFKIRARKQGFDTVEVTAITNVVKTSGIHPVLFVWIFAFGLWVILILIKFARRNL